MRISAVAFDLDGTLVDSRQDLAAAINLMRGDLGLPALSLEAVVGMVGEGVRVLVRRALGGEPEPELFARALRCFLEHYERLCTEKTRPYSGVPEALAALGERYPLGLLTNKPEHLTRRILDHLGLLASFRALVCGDTLPVRKPDPEVARHLAGQLGVTVEEMVLVGDSAIDAAAAEASGCRFILVDWGYAQPEEREKLRADRRVSTPAELLRALLS